MLADPTRPSCGYYSSPWSNYYQFCCQLVKYALCVHWKWEKLLDGILTLGGLTQADLVANITSVMSTIITDLYMVHAT